MSRCPAGKRGRDELGAKIALFKIDSYANRHPKEKEDWTRQKRAYKCPLCHTWHTTRQEKRG